MLGQEVMTLFSGVRQAGQYAATMDGSKLAGGLYIYRLQTGSMTITKKLVLTK